MVFRPSSLIPINRENVGMVARGEALLLGVVMGGDALGAAVQGRNKLGVLIADNLTHAVIAALVWALAVAPIWRDNHMATPWRLAPRKKTALELVAAFGAGSLLDLDHFLAAGSLRLKEALMLPKRPLGHCLPVAAALAAGAGLTMVKCLGFPVLEGVRGSLLLLTAWLTHHLRDSIRRGLWFCPWGSLKPTPYWLYLTAMALLPLMLQPVLSLTQSAPRSSRDVSGSDFISSFWWISAPALISLLVTMGGFVHVPVPGEDDDVELPASTSCV